MRNSNQPSWTIDDEFPINGFAKMILDVTSAHAPGDEPVPVNFRLGSTNRLVCEIVDRWLANDFSYFKLRADDGATYILRHDKPAQKWELILFNREDV